MTQQPQTVSQLWPSKWLRARDLGQGKIVTITGQRIEMLRGYKSQDREAKLILSFKNATKELIVSKTMAQAVADLTGSEKFADWVGAKVMLTPHRLPTGRFTIAVKAAPVANGTPDPTAQETLTEFFGDNGQAEPEPEIDF